jgi:transcriptional regulator GlxA family with amidase domain
MSERNLRRRIETSVGLSFKALASVLRFQRTLRLLSPTGGKALGLTQAALEGGYADQAHMTREFRRHGGFTPARRPALTLGTMPLGGLAETFKIDAGVPS